MRKELDITMFAVWSRELRNPDICPVDLPNLNGIYLDLSGQFCLVFPPPAARPPGRLLSILTCLSPRSTMLLVVLNYQRHHIGIAHLYIYIGSTGVRYLNMYVIRLKIETPIIIKRHFKKSTTTATTTE